MGEARRFGLTPQLDIEHLVSEAQHRWLRPTEICEILRNYRNFRIAPEPPNKPTSGSLFLFDRKILRYFRKDSHNWRKKKDGKTVKEAHERLKAESIDVLHCYYAHGEENENFQRRTYWMLEEAFMHIVLVHYLEVKGNKASFNRARDAGEIMHGAPMESPVCSSSFSNEHHLPSQTTDDGSSNSAHMSEYEDAESDNHQARSRYHPFFELQQCEDGPMKVVQSVDPYTAVASLMNHCDHQRLQAEAPNSDFYSVSQEEKTEVFDDTGHGLAFCGSRTQFEWASWDDVLGHCTTGFQSAFQPSIETEVAAMGGIQRRESLTFGELLTEDLSIKQRDLATAQFYDESQFFNDEVGSSITLNTDLKNNFTIEGKVNSLPLVKQSSLDLSNIEGEGLKKYDSFSRWMSKELGEVDDSHMKPSFETYWNSVETGNIIDDPSISNSEHLDAYVMSPSVSQDQLYSIVGFSPNWAYTDLKTKVLVTGNFFKKVEKCKWSCMFGEVEVPAEVLADGILCCHAPPHRAGRFPFYITCSNRLACSEVREFEYRTNDTQYMETSDRHSSYSNDMHLRARLERLLSPRLVGPSMRACSSISGEKFQLSNKISLLLIEADDGWVSMLKPTHEKGFSPNDAQLEKALKAKLRDWLLQKIGEDGKGPSVVDKEGLGVVHLAAALGYDWAIKPTIIAGVSINFRDSRGWTALHWAAFCGREGTVVSLISLGAEPGLLTDPTAEFPSGRTPADLASSNGYKGIAGFLAESALTSQLSTLTLKDTSRGVDMAQVSGVKAIENIAEQSVDEGMQPSLKDSLIAVRNASLAVAHIHQVYRVHSFQRKKLIAYGNDKCGMSDERALSLISIKAAKSGKHDTPWQAAAIRIQNKFRGWKGRKQFLITRESVVKIQAHVRGHQVRKRYRKIIWTVGIVEKAVLRWRRKGSGLRGFRPEGLIEMQTGSSKEDDYDFLQVGRKQTEARLQKALARVKSMVNYPEAREQYRRLMTAMQEKTLEEAVDGDFMIELDEIWEDDSIMPPA